jgi:integrase
LSQVSEWAENIGAEGVPGNVIAQLMGHAHVDTTLNVYTQVFDGQFGTPAVARAGIFRERRLVRPARLELATSCS